MAAAAAVVAGGALQARRRQRGKDKGKLVLRAAPTTITGLSEQARAARKQMNAAIEEDEELKLMMAGLRGQNLNDDDQAVEGLEMQLADIDLKDDETGLPLTYDPEKLAEFFDPKVDVQLNRFVQVITTFAPLIAGSIKDKITGRPEIDSQVERAAQFNSVVTTLGPFFIKLGQALSIRPDILSPRAMVELQKLCDKVPSYPTDIAMATLSREFERTWGNGPVGPDDLFVTITPEPVAAASLGQVYKATLKEPAGAVVAVKIQRPQVLETVSLDLYLLRKFASSIRGLQESFGLPKRTDLVALLDEFASRIYEELDYVKECENGVAVAEDMKDLERVVVPMNYPQYCTRRVHMAEWLDGEKLSQSQADDVRELVNVGVIAYLTQLLDKGLFHADPHPGNMLRTPDGRLGILDFGLMTKVTEDQRYGMIEAIAHLVHRDYAEIGDDFQKLDFIPEGTDVKPIVPALSRVFDSALSGGGAKGINFNELAADLAQITFEFPFRIPPYFALVIRAIGVLEGIALVGDPNFAIVDEAYPWLSKHLLTTPSERLRATFRYMVYGKEGVFDADRLIDLLRALEAFRVSEKLKEPTNAPGTAAALAELEGSELVGLVQDQKKTETKLRQKQMAGDVRLSDRPTSWAAATADKSKEDSSKEAISFLLSDDGAFFREFLVEEAVNGIDCLGRGGLNEVAKTLAANSPLQVIPGVGKALLASPLGPFGALFAPPLSKQEESVVANIEKLLTFFLGESEAGGSQNNSGRTQGVQSAIQLAQSDPKLARGARDFAAQLARRAFEKVNARALRTLAGQIKPEESKAKGKKLQIA